MTAGRRAAIDLRAGTLPGPQQRRALWLREALAWETSSGTDPLDGDTTADVCVIGGGFTGLWTAIALKRRSPGTDVVLLDGDICGGGASGRNGGFAMTWWSKFPSLVKTMGTDGALEMGRRSEAAVREIGRFCEQHDIDAGFRLGGWVMAATSPAQVGAWTATVDALAAAGAAPFLPLTPDEVGVRTGSRTHLAGVFEPSVAILQPALLARGLARVARELGVRIHERTPVGSVVPGTSRHAVQTQTGTVRAESVVLAINAWAGQLPEFARSLVITSSDIVATAPDPARLGALGWTPDLAISDARRLITYYRQTDDGRVVFGKGGGRLAFRSRVDGAFHGPPAHAAGVEADLRARYPTLAAVPVAETWSGPVDYSVTGVPFLCPIGDRPGIYAGTGFSGNGVGPSRVAGDVLTSLVLDGRDDSVPPELTRQPPRSLPYEPLRYVGGRVVRAATARKERAEDAGRAPGAATLAVTRLDPTGFVDRGDG